jgi:hypothetical protein
MLLPEELLERADSSARLLLHARRLVRLNALLAGIIAPGLAQDTRVVNVRSGQVILQAANGAVAAKLRQLGPRLLEHFSKNGLECNEIKVKVQPPEAISAPPRAAPPPISADGARIISACADALPRNAPLGEALRRLAQCAGSASHNMPEPPG